MNGKNNAGNNYELNCIASTKHPCVDPHSAGYCNYSIRHFRTYIIFMHIPINNY